MKEAKYKLDDYVVTEILVHDSKSEEMPIEPDNHRDDYADTICRCHEERRSGQVVTVKKTQINDNNPDFEYQVEFSYQRTGGGTIRNYRYTAWVKERYLDPV